LLRGAVRDVLPGHRFQERISGLGGSTGLEPLAMHHMLIEMTVAFPELVVASIDVRFEIHPHESCPLIADHYAELVGVSIGRGYTHRVRDLFGGPRGCSHTTALLQAMSPVVMQCVRAMETGGPGVAVGDERTRQMPSHVKGTCHVWHEDGRLWQMVSNGEVTPAPIPVRNRFKASGLDPDAIGLTSADS